MVDEISAINKHNIAVDIGIDPEMILKTFDKNDGRTWL